MQNDRYRDLFDYSADAILIINGDKFVDCNAAAVNMLRYANKQDLLNTHPSQLSPERQPDGRLSYEKANEMIAIAFEKGSHRFEWDHKRADDEVFPVEVLLTAISDGDQKTLHVVWRDITDRIKAEKELLKMKKIESVCILAGGIAHDFNNILAAILGNINLALFDNDLNEKTKNLLTEVEKASLRAKNLTQQLLTFSKGGAPVREISSLKSIIKESADFVLHGDKVACKYNIPDDLYLVDIDKGLISQVIQNIVLNASQAMLDGGTIEITCVNITSADKIFLLSAKDGKYVKIFIKDSGIGIPEKLIDKIFDPYFSTKQEGSGLGLAICHSIVTKHDGTIFVDSSPDTGTSFTICLPALDNQISPSQAKTEKRKVLFQAKILIMDDEEMVREVIKGMINMLGHEVILSTNGTEALNLYQEAMISGNPISLIIMDLTISGGMGGKDAVREVHNIDPKAKVIVSSGYSNDPVMANFRDYGFCAKIVKPFEFQDLSRVISQVLS